MKASELIGMIGEGIGIIEAFDKLCDYEPDLAKAILTASVEYVYNEVNDGETIDKFIDGIRESIKNVKEGRSDEKEVKENVETATD